MPKNIVLCCDGTANELATDRTNVLKLCLLTIKNDQQRVYYQPGIGTADVPGVINFMERWLSRMAARAFGAGLADNIGSAYSFLVTNYDIGDQIFLFGFSRGAYTARAVAGLVQAFGLLRRDNDNLIPYAIRILTRLQKASTDRERARCFSALEAYRSNFSWAAPEIWFVGVWDTVYSVSWFDNALIPFSANNPKIRVGRHAISIDERRAYFRSNLWRPAAPPNPSGPQDIKQVWFAGVHSDVGGGYPEEDSGLSKIALQWMLREAEAAGLLIDPTRRDEVLGLSTSAKYVPPDPNATMHDSLEKWWWTAEVIPKRHWNWVKGREEHRMNLGRRRVLPPGALIHRSVTQRTGYKPPNLPMDAIIVD